MTQKALQDSVDRLTTAIQTNNAVLARLAILATNAAAPDPLDGSSLSLAIDSLESSNKNAQSIIDSLTPAPPTEPAPVPPTGDAPATEQPTDPALPNGDATDPAQADPHTVAKAL